jgi:hypothetical protein
MPGNRRSCPSVESGASGDPRDTAKAGLPESHVLANGVEFVSPVRPYLRRLGPAACVAVSLGSEREAQAQVGLVDGWSPGPGPWSTVQPGPAVSAPWAVD